MFITYLYVSTIFTTQPGLVIIVLILFLLQLILLQLSCWDMSPETFVGYLAEILKFCYVLYNIFSTIFTIRPAIENISTIEFAVIKSQNI